MQFFSLTKVTKKYTNVFCLIRQRSVGCVLYFDCMPSVGCIDFLEVPKLIWHRNSVRIDHVLTKVVEYTKRETTQKNPKHTFELLLSV